MRHNRRSLLKSKKAKSPDIMEFSMSDALNVVAETVQQDYKTVNYRNSDNALSRSENEDYIENSEFGKLLSSISKSYEINLSESEAASKSNYSNVYSNSGSSVPPINAPSKTLSRSTSRKSIKSQQSPRTKTRPSSVNMSYKPSNSKDQKPITKNPKLENYKKKELESSKGKEPEIEKSVSKKVHNKPNIVKKSTEPIKVSSGSMLKYRSSSLQSSKKITKNSGQSNNAYTRDLKIIRGVNITMDGDYIKEKTKGFMKIEKCDFKLIETNDFIRYINHRGEFVAGGYVTATGYDDDYKCTYWVVSSSFSITSRNWKVFHDKIHILWKRTERPAEINYVLDEIINNRRAIVELTKYLEKKYDERILSDNTRSKLKLNINKINCKSGSNSESSQHN